MMLIQIIDYPDHQNCHHHSGQQAETNQAAITENLVLCGTLTSGPQQSYAGASFEASTNTTAEAALNWSTKTLMARIGNCSVSGSTISRSPTHHVANPSLTSRYEVIVVKHDSGDNGYERA